MKSRIVFIENYSREQAWQDRRFIMELISPAVMQLTGQPVEPLIDTVKHLPVLLHFQKLVPGGWEKHYFELPSPATAWLERRFGSPRLVISYEMPVWLRRFLDTRHIPWIDIRLSPLRFSHDLMLAVRSSCRALQAHLLAHQIPLSTIRLHATQMQASARRLIRLQAPGSVAGFSNSLVFIGQTVSDAALLAPPRRILTLSDFAEQIKALAADRSRIYYHPHPYAAEHALREAENLKNITGHSVSLTGLETASLLALEGDVKLTGISSGLLQEAEYFGLKTHPLYPPVCPLEGDEACAQYYIDDLMNTRFWEGILAEGRSTYRAGPGHANRLRHLHNLWFSYGSYMRERNENQVLEHRLARVEHVCYELSQRQYGWRRLSRAIRYRIFPEKKLKSLFRSDG